MLVIVGGPFLIGMFSLMLPSVSFQKNPPNSTYVSDAMTCIIRLHYIGTGPFYRDIDCIGALDFSIKISTCSAL